MRCCVGLFVGLLLVGHYGCAPTVKVTRERMFSGAQIIQRVNDRNEEVKTLWADGTITIESPEMSVSGSFELKLKKPDSLRVDVNGPFGIHVSTLMFSRKQFLYYNWRENTAVSGKPDDQTLNALFRIRMQFDDMMGLFVGKFPAPEQSDTIKRFYFEGDQYIVRYHTQAGIKVYHIDADFFTVMDYRFIDSTGRTALIALASEIENIEGIALPKFLRVIFPEEERSITITYDDANLNKPVVCSFFIPEQAEVINR